MEKMPYASWQTHTETLRKNIGSYTGLIMAMSAKDKRVRDDAGGSVYRPVKKNAGGFSFKRRGKHSLPALISGHSPWICVAGGAGVLLPLSGGGG